MHTSSLFILRDLSLYSQRLLLLPNLFRSREWQLCCCQLRGLMLPSLTFLYSAHLEINTQITLNLMCLSCWDPGWDTNTKGQQMRPWNRTRIQHFTELLWHYLCQWIGSVIQKLVIASQHEIWTLKIVFILISHHKTSWHGLTWQWDWCGCAVSAVW